jgi:alpha-galactosidase
MGVNTWYPFGSAINEQIVVGLANEMVTRGLEKVGYRYLWIDGGWWQGTRDGNGNITVDPIQWPHGMAWLAAYIHSRGLLAGIYTDAGTRGCAAEHMAGSYNHYQQDINTFAAWGYDAVKVDFCGGHVMHLDPSLTYRQLGDVIKADQPRRPMLLAVSNGAVPNEYGAGYPSVANSAYGSFRYGPSSGNSWRTGPDIGFPGFVPFSNAVRNFELDAQHPAVAGVGHWNDPDYLAPNLGMYPSEAESQFSLWAIAAAPLIAGVDVRLMSLQTQLLLENRQAIAIDQDPLGVQGRLAGTQSQTQIWVKPLTGKASAVALLNLGQQPVTVRVTRELLGLGAARAYTTLDVWSHQTVVSDGTVLVSVAPQTAVLLRMVPVPQR